MTTYRERRLAKAERLRKWAHKRDTKADSAYQTAKELSDGIALGQPILVGHHSEGAHRRRLSRIDNNMRASIDHTQKATEMRQKAENIEAAAGHAIYSDDHDAIQRLEERIADGLAKREAITAFNKTARKGSPDYSLLSEEMLKDYGDYCSVSATKQGEPFPSFVTSNLSANTRRLQKRLDSLKRKQEKAA